MVLLGCSNTGKPTLEAAPPSTAAATTTTTTEAATTTTEPLHQGEVGPDNLLGFIATPIGVPEVHEEPDAGSPRIEIGETSPAGAPMTFAVVGIPDEADDGWIRVLLPVRPNDRTGYVPSSSVEISRTALRAFVDLSDHSMHVERDGEEIARFTIAIGAEDNPTPVAPSYVTELLQTPNPGGAYGPFAFGLSIHSDQITEFGEGGDGQVGIHGTNRPELIGSAVSAGCVRLNNDDIRSLVDLEVPLGMPVFISA